MEKEREKSPKLLNKKISKKTTLMVRQKTPSKSNKYIDNFSFNKNINNNDKKNHFNKTMYNNNPKKNVANEEDEKNNYIFGDVGNVIDYNKNFLYKK